MIRISSSSSAGSGKASHERLSEDRDLVRHVLGRLPEAEQVRVAGQLLLDDDGDVLERPRKLRRQLVERPPDVLLEGHAVTAAAASGGRTWNALDRQHPEHEPADVREERDAAARGRDA